MLVKSMKLFAMLHTDSIYLSNWLKYICIKVLQDEHSSLNSKYLPL